MLGYPAQQHTSIAYGEEIMNRSSKWLLLALCVTSLLLVPAFAQKTSGTINGVVYDPSGAVVPGVSVTVTNTGTGTSRTITTDNQGVYSAPELEPGIYKVTAKAGNLKSQRSTGRRSRFEYHKRGRQAGSGQRNSASGSAREYDSSTDRQRRARRSHRQHSSARTALERAQLCSADAVWRRGLWREQL